ncbi:hypothetical protein BBK14_08900 [Parafrankia soli]|uniref:Uncharacterized protein n=1 Tax=Parafrankia soli TaxID=2599596 RepID=A0A1S1PF90_9ACTN|nr:hypothetical protein BBK14_08900 [Parafrankia soli]
MTTAVVVPDGVVDEVGGHALQRRRLAVDRCGTQLGSARLRLPGPADRRDPESGYAVAILANQDQVLLPAPQRAEEPLT